jgi:hypothetical protein
MAIIRGNLCPKNQWKNGHFENEECGGLPFFFRVTVQGFGQQATFKGILSLI